MPNLDGIGTAMGPVSVLDLPVPCPGACPGSTSMGMAVGTALVGIGLCGTVGWPLTIDQPEVLTGDSGPLAWPRTLVSSSGGTLAWPSGWP